MKALKNLKSVGIIAICIFTFFTFTLVGCVGEIVAAREADAQFQTVRKSLVVGMTLDDVRNVIGENTLEYQCDNRDSNLPSIYREVKEYYVFGDSHLENILVLRYKIRDNEIVLHEITVAPERSWLPTEDIYCVRG